MMFSWGTFLCYGDENRIVYEDENWQVRWHCNRGYEPWWTLHKRRQFLGFSWWSDTQKWGDYEPIMEFVRRWNDWEDFLRSNA